MYKRIVVMIITAVLTLHNASAGLIEYPTGFLTWQHAAGNNITTVDFTDYPVGTFISNQYQDLGVTFTNVVWTHNSAGYSDGHGLAGNNGIRMEFDVAQHAIALHYLGVVMFQLSYQGEVIATSSQFSIGGPLKFAGIISDQSFDEVYLFVPQPPFSNNAISIDNLYWGAPIPAPGALGLFALAALGRSRRCR